MRLTFLFHYIILCVWRAFAIRLI